MPLVQTPPTPHPQAPTRDCFGSPGGFPQPSKPTHTLFAILEPECSVSAASAGSKPLRARSTWRGSSAVSPREGWPRVPTGGVAPARHRMGLQGQGVPGKTRRCAGPWGVPERCQESLGAAGKPRASGNAFLPRPRLQRHEMGLLRQSGTVPLGTHPRSHRRQLTGVPVQGTLLLCCATQSVPLFGKGLVQDAPVLPGRWLRVAVGWRYQ